MLKNIKPGQYVEIVGLLAVVISLALVWSELRQSREVALNESYGTQIESSTNIMAFLGENSSVLRRGCAGEELSEDEDMLFTALVRAIDRFHFFRFLRSQNGFTDYPLLAAPQHIARHRIWYPGFNEKWLEIWDQNQRGGGDFYQTVQEQYEILKSEFYPGQYDSSLCGAPTI